MGDGCGEEQPVSVAASSLKPKACWLQTAAGSAQSDRVSLTPVTTQSAVAVQPMRLSPNDWWCSANV